MAKNNIETRLLAAENEFLRTKMNEQQQNFDMMTRREIELEKIIDALQKQRNQYKEDYKFLSTAMKDEIHKLKNEIKQYKTQIEDYNQQIKNKQTELDNIKDKLINKHEQLGNIKDKLISKQEELHSIQEKVTFQQKELAKCNAALSEKSSEVRALRNKLDKNEEKYKKLLLHNQMALVRSGFPKFEERKITNFLPIKKRKTI
jgi:chromosome segregation ATPase